MDLTIGALLARIGSCHRAGADWRKLKAVALGESPTIAGSWRGADSNPRCHV
jgi:hypothetical protein